MRGRERERVKEVNVNEIRKYLAVLLECEHLDSSTDDD